ncbi:MAG: VWA domain-containing protein [Actinomycetota bacterium]
MSGAAPLERLVAFGRALRDAGLPVGTGRLLRFCHACGLVPVADVYWAGRATLVSRREHVAVYDRVFREVMVGVAPPPPLAVAPRATLRAGPADGAGRAVRVEGEPPQAALASPRESLRTKSFSRCSAQELAALARLMARIRLRPPARRTRRLRHDRRGALDVRRTLRRAQRTEGEPFDRAWRTRRRRHRRVVLLVDVSGSMSAYSRALVMFAHAAVRAHPDVEAFCFGTRLTRLTAALRDGTPDRAIARAAAAARDWDGGTRIGDCVKEFLDRYGHAGMARGAVVVVASDGLDVGDPAVVALQMRRLARLAHRVVWLNPLKESPAYRPLARGMAAALPSVDLFASGHDLASLEGVAASIAGL